MLTKVITRRCTEGYGKLLMNNVIKAMAFAADKHRNQRRKDADASPYFNHPIALANVLANEADVEDERVLVAAVLHDTIEDTETTEQQLVRLFGKDVADIVLEVTDDKSLPKDERKRLQIEHAPHVSRRAKTGQAGRQDLPPAGHRDKSPGGLVS
jgi:guanosine-3',5'-bis(diphosphate) 3'-pyrophosphohydrolase